MQGWAPWDKAKKKFAEKKERDAKRTAAFAEGTSLGNKHLDQAGSRKRLGARQDG